MRRLLLVMVCVLLLSSCKKKGEVNSHETFIRNYYGYAYKLDKLDTVEAFETTIRMTTGKGKIVFSSPDVPLANETFEGKEEDSYVQIDMLSRKEFVPLQDTLTFTHVKWLPDTVTWHFKGQIK